MIRLFLQPMWGLTQNHYIHISRKKIQEGKFTTQLSLCNTNVEGKSLIMTQLSN